MSGRRAGTWGLHLLAIIRRRRYVSRAPLLFADLAFIIAVYKLRSLLHALRP